MSSFLVVTIEGDIHAAAFQHYVKQHALGSCRILAVDTVALRHPISWFGTTEGWKRLVITDVEGRRLEVDEIDAIWWRRFHPEPRFPIDQFCPAVIDLIRNDSRSAILGAITASFRGAWINDPFASARAENKLTQFEAAYAAGFRIPQTLVSNSPDEVRRFCSSLENRVIVKPVKGTLLQSCYSRRITPDHLVSDENISLAPAIYQEMIPGNDHLRIHCFGNEAYTVRIVSEGLDWREDLNVPFEFVTTDKQLAKNARRVLDLLGLRMGIFDIKLNGEEPMWLEVNPQGQFLFAQALSGFNLMDRFVEFMVAECGSSLH
jgi:hypothetical protein